MKHECHDERPQIPYLKMLVEISFDSNSTNQNQNRKSIIDCLLSGEHNEGTFERLSQNFKLVIESPYLMNVFCDSIERQDNGVVFSILLRLDVMEPVDDSVSFESLVCKNIKSIFCPNDCLGSIHMYFINGKSYQLYNNSSCNKWCYDEFKLDVNGFVDRVLTSAETNSQNDRTDRKQIQRENNDLRQEDCDYKISHEAELHRLDVAYLNDLHQIKYQLHTVSTENKTIDDRYEAEIKLLNQVHLNAIQKLECKIAQREIQLSGKKDQYVFSLIINCILVLSIIFVLCFVYNNSESKYDHQIKDTVYDSARKVLKGENSSNFGRIIKDLEWNYTSPEKNTKGDISSQTHEVMINNNVK